MVELRNGRITISFDPDDGTIRCFGHDTLGVELVGEPRLRENFRLLVPLPYWRGHYILGRDQRLSDVTIQGSTARLVWQGLQSRQGRFDIEVTLTVTLERDDAIFQIEIGNHSPHVIEEVYTPALGGLANFAEQDEWILHHADGVGKGQEWLVYKEFPGTYLGPAYPVWQRPYPQSLIMPWIDLYNRRTRRGVYVGNHDLEPRWSTPFGQLFPGTTYRKRGQEWPAPTAVGGEPVGMTLAWVSFPFVQPGVRYLGPPIVFHFHEGTWYTAADYYRSWFLQHWPLDKRDSWLAAEDAWQSTIISYPDDTIGYRFADLPRLAQDARAAGINVLQIDGWDIGGIDRDYPLYTPDPRLGTWADLVGALEACRAEGVRVLLFSNLHVANIETNWFQRELLQYAVKDPRGFLRNSMGWEYNTLLGLANQCEWRMVTMNPSHPGYRRIILDQLMNTARLGASGTQIDKLHGFARDLDFSPTSPRPIDLAVQVGGLETLAEFHRQARAVRPDFCIASETHWDRTFPYVDAAYSRFFSIEHLPTIGYTFPEFRESCCVTGPVDFGLVNNCVRYRHIINVEARCLHGSIADQPQLARYVAETLRLRRQLRPVLWDSRLVEPLGVELSHDGTVKYSVHHSLETSRKAVVLNHFEERIQRGRLAIPEATRSNAVLYRPFKRPEEVRLPVDLTVDVDEVVVVVFE